ncbi:MAG: SMP-30/gluconolactonase/LRE family protein [Caldilineaceae bacterium SB0668_bin_21]|nr:SMP-30/gluconolactonase/LRE family protein [Caldilineaceae bacterium SB0668_bin_21]MYC20005.1 SMP-30/gluconolactonase/LRE family protein [Caldilineaceae bacterium SB0662_bin_25]
MSTSSLAERDWSGGVVRYPDPAVEVLDDRFSKYRIGNAVVERLFTGCRWAEGPVWFGDARCLIWSDIPNNRMLRWTEESQEVSVYRCPSHHSNGNTRDRQGRLVTCEHTGRRVTRTEHDGSITVLMDSFEGKRLSSPNDVVVHSDGSVWFTDPGYGIMLNYEGKVAEAELPTRVYRLDPETREATIVADDFLRPNGLCFSPDEDLLYIVDTGRSHDPDGPSHIRVFDVTADNRLENGRIFVDMNPGMADGIRCDEDGNLWAAAGWAGPGFDGAHCYAPDGTRIGQIHLPEICANLCFGGAGKNRLFMAGSQSLYSVYVETTGAQQP